LAWDHHIKARIDIRQAYYTLSPEAVTHLTEQLEAGKDDTRKDVLAARDARNDEIVAALGINNPARYTSCG
jgi:hypothetical protein